MDQFPGVSTIGRVEPGSGLIEEEQVGIADDAETDIETALLAAGRVGEFHRTSQRTGRDGRANPNDEAVEAPAWQVQY